VPKRDPEAVDFAQKLLLFSIPSVFDSYSSGGRNTGVVLVVGTEAVGGSINVIYTIKKCKVHDIYMIRGWLIEVWNPYTL
jgi:hypothetical protein